MITLYGRRSSSNVQKVLWALEELQQPYELREVGGAFGHTKESWYQALNPTSLVPTLVDDDFVLWESNAILRYLAETYGSGTLTPASDPRLTAIVNQWLDWAATAVQPGMRPIFLGLVRTPPEKRDMQGIEGAMAAMEQHWQVLETALHQGRYLVGDEFSIADIPVAIQAYRWKCLASSRVLHPGMERWLAELANRRSFKEIAVGPLS
jgi:glutathione S-transferase